MRGRFRPRARRPSKMVASAVAAACLGFLGREPRAQAVRRMFEPTDLEIERAGFAELNLQVGLVRGASPWRLSVPDFELDLGLTSDFELDIDGALSWQGPDDGRFRLDHLDDDNLWVAAKASILSWDDPLSGRGLGLGIQLGPKCPTARGARGLGAEALLLFAWHTPRVQVVLNGGGLLDPRDGDGGRPFGVEGGVDLNVQLDQAGHFALLGEAGGVSFRSGDPAQLVVTAGLAFDPRDDLEISLVALAGLLEGSDRYGVLVGISPKLSLFGR